VGRPHTASQQRGPRTYVRRGIVNKLIDRIKKL
jgi:DNA-directed RNA polymerase specialized sigma24 family protein